MSIPNSFGEVFLIVVRLVVVFHVFFNMLLVVDGVERRQWQTWTRLMTLLVDVGPGYCIIEPLDKLGIPMNIMATVLTSTQYMYF